MRLRLRAAATWVSALLLALGPAYGQDAPPPEQTVGEPTRDAVQARIARIEADTTLEEDVRERTLEVLRATLERLGEAEGWFERSSRFESDARDAPARIASLREELARERPDPTVPAGLSLTELDQGAATLRAQLDAARKAALDLEAEAAQRTERRLALPELLAAAQARLVGLDATPLIEVTADEPVQLTEARRLREVARRRAVQAEIRSHELEAASIDVRRDLLTARRNQAARNVAIAERALAAWQEAADELRRLEAERRQREADERVTEAGQVHPALADLAQVVADLASERSDLAMRLESLAARSAGAEESLADLRASFADTRRKLDAAGLTEAIGRLLRQQKLELAEQQRLRETERAGKEEMARVQLRIIELDNRIAELVDFDAQVEAVSARAEGLTERDRTTFEQSAREILASEQENVQALVDDYKAYFRDLVSLDTTARESAAVADRFSRYINERVLWVRSSAPLWESGTEAVTGALLWILDPADWLATVAALFADVEDDPAAYVAGALVLLVLLGSQRRLRRALRESGERAARATELSIRPTLQGVLWTLLAALALPVLLAFLGWRLGQAADAPSLCGPLSEGLVRAALLLFVLNVAAFLVRSYGLGQQHFEWREVSVGVVRRNLLWLTPIVVPLEAVVHMLSAQEMLSWNESVSRIVFVVQMAAMGTFLQRVLHPKHGVLRYERRRRGLATGMRGLWYALGVLVPLALAVLAVVGFFYTAVQLSLQIQLSAAFLVLLLVAQGVALRWVLLVRRRLAIAQARERRAAEIEAREAEADGEVEVASERAIAEEARDAATISSEIRQLARTLIGIATIVGLWLIWVDVLPALGVARDVDLWSHTVRVSQTITDAAGNERIETVDQVVPVSLADFALALMVLFGALIATRSLPALIEVWLLQRLSLVAGERYAITTLTRYAITIVGIVWAFDEIGVGWSTVQWLAAGVSVGLGFGLQEIFANFVSGLTLLFERPIRVGDWVTVGGIEGAVTRIRIRATTIVDRDLKELVVPNREFVTGQLINWTLSDPVTRVVVPVGIAYGSDVDLAEKKLIEVGRACPYSLDDPPPNVVFREFGNSSLDFELRVFVTGREIFPRVVHDLHRRVDRAFREAGITIAFPQQDLHIVSSEPVLRFEQVSGRSGRQSR